MNNIYNEILNCKDKQKKGKLLEDLTKELFINQCENLFTCIKNCRTSTNEIDLLIEWSENARNLLINLVYKFFGDSFICECKNYNKAVNVTYVGKFCSLLSISNVNLGIMISWNGVTGRSKWSDAKGLIKKIGLKENIYIIVIDKNDILELCEKKKNLFTLVKDKYNALKYDIEYSKYIKLHEAEEHIKR